MTKPSRASPHKLASVSVPLFWPMIAAAQLAEQGVDLYYARNLEFLAEEECKFARNNDPLRGDFRVQ